MVAQTLHNVTLYVHCLSCYFRKSQKPESQVQPFLQSWLQCLFHFPRFIQKISSVYEYCLCSAAVTMVRMRAEFVDTVARHGRTLQTFEPCLRIVLCVYNV